MIEIPVTMVGNGPNRKLVWDCPHCGVRMESGRHGISMPCKHKVYLRTKTMDLILAVFEDKPQQ